MKSERRHELQTNTLADWVGHQIDAIKPHVGLIVTVILGALAVIVAWMYFLQWNSSRTTAAWSDFYRAADDSEPAALVEMAQRHAGEPASVWAMLLAADTHLGQGAEQAFSDRKAAEKSLKQAIENYQFTLENVREPVLRRRALYGLAEANESLFAVTADKKALEAARENYQQVARQWPETMLGRTAQRKADELAAESTQEFLTWFAEQEPVQASTGQDGVESAEPTSPFDLSTLPGASDLLLPEEEQAIPTPEDQAPDLQAPKTPENQAPEATEDKSPAAPESEAPQAPEGEVKPDAASPPSDDDAAPPETETPEEKSEGQ